MAAEGGPFLILENIAKRYGDHVVLEGISVSVRRGELITFLGPSGCGKTTLLRIIGGFVKPDNGEVVLDGVVITDTPPNERDTRMVFQNYALFPHLTVAANIAYGLRIRRWAKEKVKERVDELLALVKLEGLADRSIDKLSGGQQQRVALARALSLRPKVLLLDEPLSNLDANLRVTMRAEIRRLQEELNLTAVFVTHDQAEAMSISDRIAVLSDGTIQQIGNPSEIYEKPVNEFIAGFVGHVNVVDGRIEKIDGVWGSAAVMTPLGMVEVALERRDLLVGDRVKLVIRPEAIRVGLDRAGLAALNVFEGRLESSVYLGSLARYAVTVKGERVIVDQPDPRTGGLFESGGKVFLAIPATVHLLRCGS